MNKKTALITGITGQDGSLLAEYLLANKYKVIAPTRVNPNLKNLQLLGLLEHPNLITLSYKKTHKFKKIIQHYQPDEIYHLAAMTHVGDSHLNPDKVFTVNTVWTVKLLNYVYKQSPQSKFFFASSSELFSKSPVKSIDETSLKEADSPYGLSKLAAHKMVEYYREVKGIFACNGILFNHESRLRPDNFVSMKIFKNVARIVKEGGTPLELGNIEAKKDWGYAKDYITAFHLVLQNNQAKDYVLSTGKLFSVKQMVTAAFEALNYPVQWQGKGIDTRAFDEKGRLVVRINPKYFRPLDEKIIVGNSNKAETELGWKNLTPFHQWVKDLTLNEYRKLVE